MRINRRKQEVKVNSQTQQVGEGTQAQPCRVGN